MKIIFDFDHTIFDMTSMHDEIMSGMESLGLSREDYRDVYSKVTQWKLFTVEDIASKINQHHGLPRENIVEVFENVANSCDLYLYDDVHQCCKSLRADGHKLYLLSWGDENWQNKKIESAKVAHHFEEIITVSQLKADCLGEWYKAGERIVLVDDKPAELKAVQDKYPDFHLIRLRRPNGKYSDLETPPGIAEAIGMNEVINLISELQKT